MTDEKREPTGLQQVDFDLEGEECKVKESVMTIEQRRNIEDAIERSQAHGAPKPERMRDRLRKAHENPDRKAPRGRRDRRGGQLIQQGNLS